MTLISVFQGKRCALLVSDLQVQFVAPGKPPQLLIVTKFRRLPNGDYLAYNGRLNSDEYSVLMQKPLETLIAEPLAADPRFRTDQPMAMFYAQRSTAQLYAGDLHTPLFPLLRGQPMCSADEGVHSQRLVALTSRFLQSHQNYHRDALRELSEEYRAYYLGAEAMTTSFGGFESYLLYPGKFKRIDRAVSKLRGNLEAHVDTAGAIHFPDTS